tara:strand:+ start:120 stop:452 length:333 start_codon:yes stop_codon:yes gene_type:complete
MIISSLEKQLEVEQKNSQWAKSINISTRRLHIDVWCSRPDKTYVLNEVIPTFERARDLVANVPHEGEYGKHVGHYANCIQFRIENIHKYVDGGKPLMPEESEISGKLLRV